ncbi:hypothetical protein [uncultured Chryseobacterium sp.]|uniref:hypothetical protein n=1 Tax=uncultured Chryseobacterium sp. TaxID=259322 RepID=UPI0025D40E9A|nr:hypothetical protein [uncultured Chryseobacterium sp.]
MNWFFSKTYKHKCPDGTVRIIHKNIDHAFPLSLKENNKSFSGDLDVENIGNGKLKAEYQNKIKGLLFSINEQNQSLMINFRFAYAAFQADPCGNNSFITRQSELFSLGQQRLMELKTQITGLITLAESYPNNPEKVLPMYRNIIDKMSNSSSNTATVQAIVENREAANKWIKGQSNE